MGRYAKDKGGGEFAQPSEGTHVARCFGIVDIGTQRGEYQNQPTVREQIIVRWELPHELIDTDDGPQPMIVSKFYTNSLNEKANLCKDLEAWRGRKFTEEERNGFDLMNILGKPCQVTIVHNDKGKARVTSVTGMAKGTTCPPAVNPTSAFWLDEWDDNAFAQLPEGFQRLISQSDEWKALNDKGAPRKQALAQGIDPDDIPF